MSIPVWPPFPPRGRYAPPALALPATPLRTCRERTACFTSHSLPASVAIIERRLILIPCSHYDIKIVQRSKRQSAVAAATYQSGDRLFSEYDQRQKYYSEKQGIVHTEILLSDTAPPEYADRNTLWNAVKAVECQWNSQLARRFIMALPRELSHDEQVRLMREYCQSQFVAKGIITLEDRMDIERKGSQNVQGTLYVRFACFGNGSLQALHDKSDGFYRRQLLLTTKDKADGREDDPFLIDKMKQEKEGIFLWGLEGLHRLMTNKFRFTISERAAANLEEARASGNNIISFLKSKGYFEIADGMKCKSTDFYRMYARWCEDNLEKPLAAKTFLHYVREHQKEIGIVYDDKCIGNNRGFRYISLMPFVPVDEDDPDLPWH